MKKIFFWITFFFLGLSSSFGFLEVKTNLPAWEYQFPIEIYLLSNDKTAKIFYYTDGIWRMDTILEYKHPLLLKNNTTVDFFATSKNFQDTSIQTAKFFFTYSDKIDLVNDRNTFAIKNNTSDIQNIGYWKIVSQNFSYEIPANTFLEKNKTFPLFYPLSDWEKVQLFSPDNILKKEFTYTTPPIIPKEISVIEKENDTQTPDINSTELSEEPLENTIIETVEENLSPLEDNIATFDIFDWVTASVQKEGSTKNNNWFYIILWIFVFITFCITLYNIYLVAKEAKNIKIKTWKK